MNAEQRPVSDEKGAVCTCHGPDRPHAPHQACDMDCQPDWHRDGCAIYLPLPPPQAEKDQPEVMVWHDEADRLTTWGTLDPPNACMCRDCVLPPAGGDA